MPVYTFIACTPKCNVDLFTQVSCFLDSVLVFCYEDGWVFYITDMHKVEMKSPHSPTSRDTSGPAMEAPWVGPRLGAPVTH